MDTDLPPLLDELAVLQATPVLRGDYQLKLARQNYFTSKQDKVVNATTSCVASF
jgi:HAUS augmin-like complex subunit 3